MKKPLSKKVKSWILVSTVWLILIYIVANMDGRFEQTVFLILGIIPLIIGWGIYWVRKK